MTLMQKYSRKMGVAETKKGKTEWEITNVSKVVPQTTFERLIKVY